MSSQIHKQKQEKLLKAIASSTGMSEAEIIQQAINRQLGSVSSPALNLTAWEDEKTFIQQKIKGCFSQPSGRDWKREDLYKR